MIRCDYSDLPVNQCAHCLGHQNPEQQAAADRTELLTRPCWIPAQYPGTCATCGEHFEPGTPIIGSPAGGWRAECCAEQGGLL